MPWLIKPDQESLGSIDFQTIHLSLASHDARFQSKPNDSFALCSVKSRECRAYPWFQFLLQRRDIVHHKIQLHPSGRARGAEILADDDKYMAITIGPNAIGLRMVQLLDEGSLENGLEQLFIQVNVGGFNLNIIEGFDVRCSTGCTGCEPHFCMGLARHHILCRRQRPRRQG